MDRIKWICAGIIAGLIIGYFLIPKTPDVKIVTEQTIKVVTKVVTNDRYIDRVITQTVTTAGTILTTIHEVIHEKPVEVINEKIIEKTITKEINYTASLSLGINPFNTAEVAGSFQYDIFKPIFIEIVAHNDFKVNNPGCLLLIGIRF